MADTYPSGCQTPQTKDDYIEHFFRFLESATPERLQKLCGNLHRRGGKFDALARHLEGELTLDQLSKRLNELDGNGRYGAQSG